MGTAQNGAITRIKGWLAHPFQSDMTAMDWVLWLGLVIVAVFLWTRILNKIIEA